MKKIGMLAAFAASAAVAWLVGPSADIHAQNITGNGVINGMVTADGGEVRALRVAATDTVNKITYTVFTSKGRYRIDGLPPSKYEVGIVEEDFSGSKQPVSVAGNQTQTVNLALTYKPSVQQGAGAAGAAAQSNYGATRVSADGSVVQLLEFDELYPPSPARDIMVKQCFTCHGPSGWHRSGPRSEAQWRRAVGRMFDPEARVAGMAPGVPQMTHDDVSKEEAELIVQYLTANFGPGSKPRDLKTDPLIRDEAALSQAKYIRYEVPPPTHKPFVQVGAYGGPPTRSLHSAWVSVVDPAIVYMTGNRSGSIVAVDTRILDPVKRTKEWRIDNPENVMVQPHGLFDLPDGKLYFVELTGDRMSALDPKTGTIERWRVPTEGGGMHSVWPDSKGNFWYTYFAAAGKIARFDSRTKQTKEYEVDKGLSGYGIVTDKKDRVWAVSLNKPVILGYDPTTDKFKSYPISFPARRVTVDSKGNVWVCQYFGNKIAKLEPETGKVTEYDLPLKYGNPYDLWPDAEDNIWVENAVYNSMVKFEPATQKWTYYPFPLLGAHTPKLDRDPKGVFWFTLGRPSGLTAFMPEGNSAAAQQSTQ